MGWSFSPEALAVRRYLYGRFLAVGQAASPAEIVAATDLGRAEVRAGLTELERGLMVMIERDTDGGVVKCPPWSSIPTDHRIEIDDRFVAYAGCAFEALNCSFVYPGQTVVIKSGCPHCGEPVELEFTDHELASYTPATALVHVGINPRAWRRNWVAACANNNFFPSGDHVKVWELNFPEFRGAAVRIADAVGVTRYPHRLDYERGADEGRVEAIFQALASLVQLPADWQSPT